MEKTIFYSWQSDLPNNKCRGFIQSCIEMAVADIQRERVHLEVAIDRDTQHVTGTPDIAEAIFSKIDQSHIFIADISIINSEATGRKTPNPNVLVELGYAAKTIGWSNIICVFNGEFGEIEDLPFDLRFRRPLIYKIDDTSNKVEDRKQLATQMLEAIRAIIIKLSAKDEVRSYIKQNLDKDVLSICNQIHKILYGYDESLSSENVWTLLSLSQQQVQELLSGRQFLGFTVLKEWEESLRNLQTVINQPFFVQHAESTFINAILRVVKSLELITSITKGDKLFEDSDVGVEGYKVVHGPEMDPDNLKDHYILLRELDSEKRIVIDSGEIKPFNKSRMLRLQKVKSEKLNSFASVLHMLLASLDNWIKKTGNIIHIGPS